jgi:Ca2+-binding EF-hand superfamily protein
VSDQWHRRQNRPEMRFPEFIVAWHCKDGENLFGALQRCSRLWRAAKGSKLPEIRLFRKFAMEKFTSDELKFFLELRIGLVGNTFSEDEVLMIPYKQCRIVLEKILGSFSPIIQVISGEADRSVKNGMIDYAEFSMVMVKFYQAERRKRRNAVRLMFQSRRFSAGQDRIDFENFVAMIQTLGFQGPIENIFDLFRESSLLSGGEVSLDALLFSMDNLAFHFYSIEIPTQWAKPAEVTTISRSVLENHWRTFMSWFEGFNDVKDKLDTWLLSKITSQVRLVDKLFQAMAPPYTLYDAYRELLDWFQFMLNVMAKGQQEPMPDQKAERQLQIIESLIDLLITFVVPQEGDKITFTEFE